MLTALRVVALIIALVPLWMALFDRIIVRRPLGARRWSASFSGSPARRCSSVRASTPGASTSRRDVRGRRLDRVGHRLAVLAERAAPQTAVRRERDAAAPRGALLLLIGTLIGELGTSTRRSSRPRRLALGYLIVFGLLIAFTSYLWLLRNARTTLVATYAYVTPVVASSSAGRS